MREKVWRTYRLTINGLAHRVQYNQATVDTLFLPFLRRMTNLQRKLGRRTLVYMVAPPGVGKTTLSLFLETISQTAEGVTPIQAIGLSGFHYHSDYIADHHVERDGKRIPMSKVKGCPETFDVEKLRDKLATVKTQNIRWPVYDRRIHDVIEDVVTVRRDILLLEGNWLLLREGAWRSLYTFADHTLFITATPETLRNRLIERKARGGMSQKEATMFYESSDRANVERVLDGSWLARETWQLLPDGDYHLKANAPQPIQLKNRAALWKKTDVSRDADEVMIDRIGGRLSTFSQDMTNGAYAAGFQEGMAAARREILRSLYNNGRMSSKEMLATFDLMPEELAEILLNGDSERKNSPS